MENGVTSIQIEAAPWLEVPEAELVSVEHPFIVKNLDKCVASLGTDHGVDLLFPRTKDARPRGNLYLHPEDASARPLQSINVATDNLVLKITVPKRRLRKRKRNDAAQNTQCHNLQYVRQSLRDNPESYRVQIAGPVHQTHRFRSLPDFVAPVTSRTPFMQKMQDLVVPMSLDKLREFQLDMSRGVVPESEIIPPPRYTTMTVPFPYNFRQGPGVKSTMDSEGNIVTLNTQKVPKLQAHSVPYNVEEVPSGALEDLPPVNSLDPALQRLIGMAMKTMDQRPVCTRRALGNLITDAEWHSTAPNMTRLVYQYTGYIFNSGPWRDAIVKFGVDPRTDPRYRVYQTMMFMLEADAALLKKKSADRPQSDRSTHLFNGQDIHLDGKVWQVCDISDPVLKKILSTQSLRRECHVEGDGWFHNGTWAKAKQIMKSKITGLLKGHDILTDYHYLRVASQIPDIIQRGGKSGVIKLTFEGVLSEERALAGSIRTASLPYVRKDLVVGQDVPEASHSDIARLTLDDDLDEASLDPALFES